MMENIMKYEGKQKKLKVSIESLHYGLHWIFENDKGESLSIICHNGSYGNQDGLFEIMPDWEGALPKNYGDTVKGFLTFGDVQKWINKLERR